MHNPVPYQQLAAAAATVANGDAATTTATMIVLDFSLNHPLVDPPTIGSETLIWYSFQLPCVVVAITSLWYIRQWLYYYMPLFSTTTTLTGSTTIQASSDEEVTLLNRPSPVTGSNMTGSNMEEEMNDVSSRSSSGSTPKSKSWQTFFRLAQLYSVLSSVAAFLTAIGISEGTTQLLKLYISRRRPNFYALCGVDISVVPPVCAAANPQHIVEAQFSFPSGHSSLSMCSMTFLVWLVLGMILSLPPSPYSSRSQQQRRPLVSAAFSTPTTTAGGHFCYYYHQQERCACWCVAIVGWGWALYVGATRLVDHWHHFSDVLAGWALGFWVATMVYFIWYPAPFALQYQKNTTAASNNNHPSIGAAYDVVSLPWSVQSVLRQWHYSSTTGSTTTTMTDHGTPSTSNAMV